MLLNDRSRTLTLRQIALLLVALILVASSFVPVSAEGHQGDPNYRSELEGVSPSSRADGLSFTVGNYDDYIALSNRSGETVVIEGYKGEPYLRFQPDGRVEANTRSPAWILNRDRYGEGDLPASADASARPSWKLVGSEGRYSWHDHRSHWMGDEIPPQVTDRSARTEVFGYSIPLRIDGQPAALEGTLFWVGSGGGPPVWPFLLLGVVGAGGLGLVFWRRRREPRPGDSGGATA